MLTSRAMSVRGLNKPIPLIALSLAAFPLIWLTIFYSFVFRAALLLGRWPTYNNPDPKRLDFTLQHAFLWLGLMSMHYTLVVAIIMAIVVKKLSRDFPLSAVISLAVVSFALLYGIIKLDPGSFFDWFFD